MAHLVIPASPIMSRSAASGRPAGSADWLANLEQRSGLTLQPQQRGPRQRQPVEGI